MANLVSSKSQAGFLQGWTRSEKAAFITVSVLSVFAAVSVALGMGHIKPFDDALSKVFQAKNITLLTLGAYGLLATLLVAFCKRHEFAPEDESKFFKMTKAQIIVFAALLVTTITFIILGKMSVSPFEKDSYIQFLNNQPFVGYMSTAMIGLGLSLLVCFYNAPKDR